LAQELWSEYLKEERSLLRAAWPKYDPALAKEDEIEIPVQINGKLRARIVVSADATEDTVREHALAEEKIKTLMAGKQVVKVIIVPLKLVNVVIR
jgi:leucyl-tRNA synthetase